LQVLLESAREKLSGALEISNVEAGLQTVGWLRTGLSGGKITTQAGARDVEVVPLSRFASGRPRREGLILGFAAVDPKELRRGVDELAQILQKS
jgi:GntR family transcriptional regulator/MocR family aminotransferase